MSDDLRTRIVAVQLEHIDRQLTNYDTGREECGCGQQGNATYMEHLADAVIEALNLDVAVTYLSVDKLRREFCVEGHYTVEVNDA
jgi:hypothetical protein